jgi:predicted  nucleic acid-binding Zn-ribbon protein
VSIREHIAHLEELSALDEQLRLLDEQLTQERAALAELKSELGRLEARATADGGSIDEMAKARTELVQEVRQMAVQVDKSREKLGRARNEREQNAATRELEELRRLQKDREEEIGKLAMLETAAAKSKEEAETEHARIAQQLADSESGVAQKLVEIETLKIDKAASRKRLAGKLPKNVLNRYDVIRQRRGVAIALTQNGTCQACHMSLPPQLFQRILRDEALELCPNCQRILYYKPPAPKDES